GENHPEFHKVKELWEQIQEKTNAAGSDQPELDKEFTQLREITNNYTVPDGVCESYEAVYTMLEEVDTAYHAEKCRRRSIMQTFILSKKSQIRFISGVLMVLGFIADFGFHNVGLFNAAFILAS